MYDVRMRLQSAYEYVTSCRQVRFKLESVKRSLHHASTQSTYLIRHVNLIKSSRVVIVDTCHPQQCVKNKEKYA